MGLLLFNFGETGYMYGLLANPEFDSPVALKGEN